MDGLWMFSSEELAWEMPPANSPQEASGRHAKRSGSGCWTCKQSKVRCDEQLPVCKRCVRLQRHCDYVPRPRKPYSRRARLEVHDKAVLERPEDGRKYYSDCSPNTSCETADD